MMRLKILAALVLIVAIALLLRFSRERRWALVFWIPALVLPVVISAKLLVVLPGRAFGPDGGFVAMASGFYLLMVAPLLALLAVVFIAALIWRPRGAGWSIPSAVGGVVLVMGALLGWREFSSAPIEVLVLDSDGHPVANQRVEFYESSFGSSRSKSTAISNSLGLAELRVSRNEGWTATVTTLDGTVCSVSAGGTTPANRLGSMPDYTLCIWRWFHKSWGWIDSRVGIYGPFRTQRRFELRLRTKDEPVSTWVTALVTEQIEAVRRGERTEFWATELGRSPEILDALPAFLSLVKANDEFARNSADHLNHFAGQISGAEKVIVAYRRKELSSESEAYFAILEKWVASDATKDEGESVADHIERRLVSLGDQLIDASKKLWTTHGPIGMGDLGPLTRRHLDEMLDSVVTRLEM